MPPVKRLLPPRSSAEAFSSTSTCAPASHAARAAVKAALPAPTTTTSLNNSGSSTLSLRIGCYADHTGVFTTAPGYLPPLALTLSYEAGAIVGETACWNREARPGQPERSRVRIPAGSETPSYDLSTHGAI